MRKDRSCSAGLLEFSTSSSPDSIRKNKSKSKERKKEKPTAHGSSSKLRSTPHALLDLTVFHIPGMDVKVQYQSKVKPKKQVRFSFPIYNVCYLISRS